MQFRTLISFILFTAIFSEVHAQPFFTIKGRVTNNSLEPIAFVNVSVVENNTIGTTTNIRGEYNIQIRNGSYTLVYSFVGFKSIKIPVIVNNRNITQNVVLEVENKELPGVVVSSKKTDKSEEIIRKVIANKQKYGNPSPYTVNAYIKASQKENAPRKKKDTVDIPPDLNLAEIYMTLNYSPPQKIKEERTGVDIRGNADGLFFLTHTDGEFNWYRNLVEVPALSSSPILSPISNSGLFAYKYKMLGSYFEGNKKFYRIKVTPGIMGNALVNGELVIMDSAWCLVSLKLNFPKYHMVEYDAFEISQHYVLEDSNYFMDKMEFNYSAKYGRTRNSGRTVIYYTDYKFNHPFKKKFFNNELSSTAQIAYERDSGFWSGIRREPFTPEEITFLRKSDSTKALMSQKKWQDSFDRNFNKVTLKKLFLTGQNNFNREKQRYWSFKPLVFSYMPLYIAGPRIMYWVDYERTFKNKKMIHIAPDINYGTYNNDLKGSLSVAKLYNPFNRGYISGGIGREFGIINPYASWVRIFTRANFYVQDAAALYHKVELLNGLYLGCNAEFANRKSIGNYKFVSLADTFLGQVNAPIKFESYVALFGTVSLSYIPFQKYIREPYQKLILGSKWPEFTVMYKKGIHGLGSTIDFDYLEFQVAQEFKLGLAGISKYYISSGEFLSHRDLRLVDNKFQRYAGPIFFSNPLHSFQGLDSNYSTIRRFYEGHYFHRFNGALVNKIPLLKKLNLIECVGGGLLYTKDRNLKYGEVSFGLEKVIRFWKERIKIGVFYVVAASNQFTYKPQFKFTIELYNSRTNKFNY